MSKFAIDLNNYPELKRMFLRDKTEFAAYMKTEIQKSNDYLSNPLEDVQEETPESKLVWDVFGMEWDYFCRVLAESLLDYKGILSNHPNKDEAKSMEILQQENNPVAIFLGKAGAYDLDGNQINQRDFTNARTLKQFIQELLYGARFLPTKDLAKYYFLREFDLIENIRMQNVEKLLQSQPAFQYQKANNIPIGQRIEGSAFFDCGTHPEGGHCPICKTPEAPTTYKEYGFCLACKGGFKYA